MDAIASLIFASILVLGVFGTAALFVAKNLLYLCGPNEVLVFSGSRDRRTGRGYRLIKGGRGVRIPLFETVDRMDLTNMIIEVSVSNAYSKGGIPLTVSGVANVKLAGHDPSLGNGIERFLGKGRGEIIRIAKDTLEGNLRGVLSQLTPEQVNEDKQAFEGQLLEEAEHDLAHLGLMLDTLKIQNVHDDVSYLDSIGRKQTAEVIKRARIAEAEAKAISTTREAENHQSARIAAIEAEMNVTRAETQTKIRDAQTRKLALVAEEVGRVKALITRATADVDVQRARVEQVRHQLTADVITPAKAHMAAMRADAKGQSAKLTADGAATVAVLEEMIATWEKGGDNTRNIFLMQRLQAITASLVSTIDDIEVEQITYLPSASGDGTRGAVSLAEGIGAALGIGLPFLQGQTGGDAGEAAE
jgi:flotillin